MIGTSDRTALDCAHSPLLVKWKLIPEFDHLRLKKLYALIIQGPLTVEGILGRIREYDNQIREALEADHLKDFKHPSAVRLLKFKNHPMIVYDMALYSEHLGFLQVRHREAVGPPHKVSRRQFYPVSDFEWLQWSCRDHGPHRNGCGRIEGIAGGR